MVKAYGGAQQVRAVVFDMYSGRTCCAAAVTASWMNKYIVQVATASNDHASYYRNSADALFADVHCNLTQHVSCSCPVQAEDCIAASRVRFESILSICGHADTKTLVYIRRA